MLHAGGTAPTKEHGLLATVVSEPDSTLVLQSYHKQSLMRRWLCREIPMLFAAHMEVMAQLVRTHISRKHRRGKTLLLCILCTSAFLGLAYFMTDVYSMQT